MTLRYVLLHLQLFLKWQIAKQLSGLNSLSLSNNKNYRLKKSRVFLNNKDKDDNKDEIADKPTIHYNSTVSKASMGKF